MPPWGAGGGGQGAARAASCSHRLSPAGGTAGIAQWACARHQGPLQALLVAPRAPGWECPAPSSQGCGNCSPEKAPAVRRRGRRDKAPSTPHHPGHIPEDKWAPTRDGTAASGVHGKRGGKQAGTGAAGGMSPSPWTAGKPGSITMTSPPPQSSGSSGKPSILPARAEFPLPQPPQAGWEPSAPAPPPWTDGPGTHASSTFHQ